MDGSRGAMVAVLGQWASGKTTAAEMLIDHLGGKRAVTFLTDRDNLTGQAYRHILSLDESELTLTVEEDGRQRYDSRLVSIWLMPKAELGSVATNEVRFRAADELISDWHERARVELGRQILDCSASERPVVIEGAFGPHGVVLAGKPVKLTLAELFLTLEATGVDLGSIGWIIVEARFDRRQERNLRRTLKVPADIFSYCAADGGDLEPAYEQDLQRRGLAIRRVDNEHDDLERFRADVIAAFDELCCR